MLWNGRSKSCGLWLLEGKKHISGMNMEGKIVVAHSRCLLQYVKLVFVYLSAIPDKLL